MKQDNEEVVVEENEGSEIDQQLAEITARLSATEDQLKRAVADYHNLEKRVAEGRSEMATWATGELIKKILPVLDNMEKTVEGAGDEAKGSGWFKGVEMSVKQLKAVLREEGLDQIGADGQFDPSLHEAVDTRDGKDGEVLEVVEKGYNLHGKVLRPARVVVGRKD